MEDNTENKDEGPVTLQSRKASNPIVSIAKKLGMRTLAWIGVYMLGYFDFSIAWMITPLLLSVLRDQWKKDKRNKLTAAREAALTNEQAMIEARMSAEELPSWVFFPDKERAEWVNSILKQLWPYVNEYVRHTLFNTVEPAVESALKAYKLTPFKFEKDRVFLGQVPPRITGIKVYDTNTSRKEIIMDLDIVFASDMEIVFKVKGISARVSDFGLRGMARVVLKPLISQIPLIGGVQVYFLKAPEIDYTLGGVAGALEIPGLNKIVERVIIEQVKNFIVLPNKFSMPLVDSIPNKVLKCPDSAGVLRVNLMRAADLVNKDGFASGKSDPYVIMTVGAHTHRVPTIMDSCNPHWDHTHDFPIEVVQGQELLLEFYDDDNKDDEFLGRAKIQTSVVAERGFIEGYWVDLVDTESGKVQVTLSWLPVIADSSAVKTAAKHAGVNDDSTKGLVHIYIDSCSGLINQREPSYKPSPMVRLVSLSPQEKSQQSWPKYYTHEPIIEQGFVMLIKAPYTDELRIDVIDTASKKDEVIGTCTIRIWSLIEQPGMEYSLQPWLLKGNSADAKIVMSASLRGLLPPQSSPKKGQPSSVGVKNKQSVAAPTSGLADLTYHDKVMPGRIRLLIHKAEELEKKDVGGKSDPYAVISYETQRAETKACKKTIEPVWDHEVWIDVPENGDNQISIELFDKDKIGKDEKMGRTSIDVRRISKQKKLSQIWDNLIGCESGKILWSAEFFFDTMAQEPDDTNFAKEEEAVVPVDPTPLPSTLTHVKQTFKEENAVKRDDDIPKPPSMSNMHLEVEPQFLPKPDNVFDQQVSAEEIVGTPYETTLHPSIDLASDLGYMGNVLGGFLRVTVHKAENLVDKDIGGKSDPYVVIRYAGQKNKSKHVKGNLDPNFEFTTGYVTEDNGPSELSIELMDHDLGKDDTLGICNFDLRKVMEDGSLDNVWANLEGVKSGRVLVSMEFSGSGYNDSPLEENITVEEPLNDGPNLSMGELIDPISTFRKRPVGNQGKIRLNILYDENKEELKVFVHEAANLPGSDLPDPPDPYVKVYLMPGKKKKKKTAVVKDSGFPQFNEEFDFSIDHDDVPKYQLKLTVVDKKGVFAKSPVLGTVDISLDNPGLKQGLADWYPLEDMDEDSD